MPGTAAAPGAGQWLACLELCSTVSLSVFSVFSPAKLFFYLLTEDFILDSRYVQCAISSHIKASALPTPI